MIRIFLIALMLIFSGSCSKKTYAECSTAADCTNSGGDTCTDGKCMCGTIEVCSITQVCVSDASGSRCLECSANSGGNAKCAAQYAANTCASDGTCKCGTHPICEQVADKCTDNGDCVCGSLPTPCQNNQFCVNSVCSYCDLSAVPSQCNTNADTCKLVGSNNTCVCGTSNQNCDDQFCVSGQCRECRNKEDCIPIYGAAVDQCSGGVCGCGGASPCTSNSNICDATSRTCKCGTGAACQVPREECAGTGTSVTCQGCTTLLQCTGDGDSSGHCDVSSGTCKCGNFQDCSNSPAAAHCWNDTKCVQCLDDNDCPAATGGAANRCDLTNHICKCGNNDSCANDEDSNYCHKLTETDPGTCVCGSTGTQACVEQFCDRTVNNGTCVGCRNNGDCDTPGETCVSGQCLCGGTSGTHCAETQQCVGGSCRGCNSNDNNAFCKSITIADYCQSNGECTCGSAVTAEKCSPGEHCVSGVCKECGANTDCTVTTNTCDSTGTCVCGTTSRVCSGDSDRCTVAGACVCGTGTGAVVCPGTAPYCVNGTCSDCTVANQAKVCKGNSNRCDEALNPNQCVCGNTGGSCSGTNDVCNSEGKCVRCTQDNLNNCGPGESCSMGSCGCDGQTCDSNYICSSNQCLCPNAGGSGIPGSCINPTPICNAQGACVACTQNSDCSDPIRAPQCLSSGVCGCTADGPCPSNQVCDTTKAGGPACVECTSSHPGNCIAGSGSFKATDRCTNNECKCGENAPCITPNIETVTTGQNSNTCDSGVCKCGNTGAKCTVLSDTCNSITPGQGSCVCGATGTAACSPTLADACSDGVCKCGMGYACGGNSNKCTSGTCKCGEGNPCPLLDSNFRLQKNRCESGECKTCTGDGQCGGSFPYCLNSTACVQCKIDTHCVGVVGKPHCGPSNFLPIQYQCVECTEHSHCTNPGLTSCDFSTGTCVPKTAIMRANNPILKQNYVTSSNNDNTPAQLIGGRLCSPGISKLRCDGQTSSKDLPTNTCTMNYGRIPATDARVYRYKSGKKESEGVLTFPSAGSSNRLVFQENKNFLLCTVPASVSDCSNAANWTHFPVSNADYFILRDNCDFDPVRADGTVNTTWRNTNAPAL